MKINNISVVVFLLLSSINMYSQTLNEIFNDNCSPDYQIVFSQFPELYIFLNDYQTCFCDVNTSSVFITDTGFCLQYYDSTIVAGKLTHAFISDDNLAILEPSIFFLYNSTQNLIYFILTSYPYTSPSGFIPYSTAYVFSIKGRFQHQIQLWYGGSNVPFYSIGMMLDWDNFAKSSFGLYGWTNLTYGIRMMLYRFIFTESRLGLYYKAFNSAEDVNKIKANSLFQSTTGNLTPQNFLKLEKMLIDSLCLHGKAMDLHLGVFPKKLPIIDK
ncbi:MAG: hypothetical protein JXR36_00695 [Bacteroidales bacterium]|nr:hypothetical protein [Bacteroidales bacterium]